MTDILDLEERARLAVRIGESHFREFKSALEGPPGQKVLRPVADLKTDVARTLVAFANADGGELLLGVEDDGTITGVAHSESQISSVLTRQSAAFILTRLCRR